MGATTALAVTAFAGAGLQAYGQIEEGRAAKEAGEWNAAMAEYDAAYAKQKAALDELRLRQEGKRTIGSARAIAGASGFATESKTDQDLILDMRRNIEMDAAIIRYQGDVNAWSSMQEAEISRYQGKAAQRAGYIRAGGTMLQGTTTMLQTLPRSGVTKYGTTGTKTPIPKGRIYKRI